MSLVALPQSFLKGRIRLHGHSDDFGPFSSFISVTTRKSPPNFLFGFALFLEFVQICALAFNARIPFWTGDPTQVWVFICVCVCVRVM